MNQSIFPQRRRSKTGDALTESAETVLREPPGMTKLFVFTHPLVSTAILLAGFVLAAIVSD